jgi:hypothetical protein
MTPCVERNSSRRLLRSAKVSRRRAVYFLAIYLLEAWGMKVVVRSEMSARERGRENEELMFLQVRQLYFVLQQLVGVEPCDTLMTTGLLVELSTLIFSVYSSKKVRIRSCIVKVLGINMAPFETADQSAEFKIMKKVIYKESSSTLWDRLVRRQIPPHSH